MAYQEAREGCKGNQSQLSGTHSTEKDEFLLTGGSGCSHPMPQSWL